jgi:GntR family transcriptional regulator
MQLHLTPRDGLPIYRQIVNQVKYLVAAGRLGPGEELPPIRGLAEQLLVNPNTIARAYLELERAGIVTKRHGSGTYISDAGSPLKRAERLKLLNQSADAFLAEARHLGIELEELIQVLRQRARAMQPEE